jgi:hypothetical protein
MADFAKLKKSVSTEKLQKALDAASNKFAKDERYWEPTVDKAGNGFAEIRFLTGPAADGDDAPDFIQIWSHSFKGPTNKWFIENSLTTIGQDDPVSEYNTKLWNSNVEANKKFVQDHTKRRLSYVSNILVVNDPSRPECNGKVFLYKYGKKIMDKIKDKLPTPNQAPDAIVDPDEIKFNPFDLWTGANFKLKIRKVDGFRNYDKSEFVGKQSPVAETDAEIEKIWRSEYSLQAEIAPDKFKSYDDLKKKLEAVLGLAGSSTPARRTAEEVSGEDNAREESDDAIAKAVNAATSTTGGDQSDDDDFAEFARLANS